MKTRRASKAPPSSCAGASRSTTPRPFSADSGGTPSKGAPAGKYSADPAEPRAIPDSVATGPPKNITAGSLAKVPQSVTTSSTAVSRGRLRITPRVPSSASSMTNTTERRKESSCSRGAATKSRAVSVGEYKGHTDRRTGPEPTHGREGGDGGARRVKDAATAGRPHTLGRAR